MSNSLQLFYFVLVSQLKVVPSSEVELPAFIVSDLSLIFFLAILFRAIFLGLGLADRITTLTSGLLTFIFRVGMRASKTTVDVNGEILTLFDLFVLVSNLRGVTETFELVF